MMILIGSVAMSYHFENYRVPMDIDVVGDYDDIASVRKEFGAKVCYPINAGKSYYMSRKNGQADIEPLEFEVAWADSMAERLIDFAKTFPNAFKYSSYRNMYVASPNVLYMLKMSHRFKKDSPHFLKTMRDIQFMRTQGCFIPDEWMPFYEQRMKDTYTNTLPKLNQSKSSFFDNSTSIYTIDHDSIHEAVAHMIKPAYEYFKPVDNEVMCSKDLFFEQPESVRLLAGLEESYVLSIERSIHPYPDVDRKWAFDTALMKLCTSISSGWFREFCWENYDAIQLMYNVEYVDRFYDALNNGRIKPFQGQIYAE